MIEHFIEKVGSSGILEEKYRSVRKNIPSKVQSCCGLLRS
jgi:hypothetical protein